jgi:hypothetical protein
MPGTLMRFDIFPDGRILLGRASWRRKLMATSAEGGTDRALSWLDYSYPADLSNDGKIVLFDEEGVGGGARYGKTQEFTYFGLHSRNWRFRGRAGLVWDRPRRCRPIRSG